jgi:glycosyltransferase involved in cell wall biosynthesis
MLSKLTGIPYVMTAHLGDVPGGVPEKTGGWFKWILPFTYPIWRSAERIVAVSEFTRQLALKHYQREITVIPNGVDVARLRPAGLRAQETTRIVFAGRLMAQKNPIQIVQTLAELKDLSWECVMLGDGPLMGEVQQAIEDHGLQERFSLPGWVTPEDVLDWFDKSDILFMPSLSEGLPVAGVQALAKGLALVVSDIGGFADLVNNGENGYLVDASEPALYAERLRGLLENPEKLRAYREKSLVQSARFDLQTVVAQYAQIFDELLGIQG